MTEGTVGKLGSCQVTKIYCIMRQLVDLLRIWLKGSLGITIPFGDGLLAVIGLFLPPVEGVLPHAIMNTAITKAMEAILLTVLLVRGRHDD